MNQKAIREIVGYTLLNTETNPNNWFERASQFHQIAELIYQHKKLGSTPACYYNAAISIELILKAIITLKQKLFEKIHILKDLLIEAEIKISEDQKCTLELFSEIIIWLGRYPTPKKESSWDNFHDNIFEKHKIKRQSGNTGHEIRNESRFPTYENYKIIYQILETEFNCLRENKN